MVLVFEGLEYVFDGGDKLRIISIVVWIVILVLVLILVLISVN